MSKNAARIGNGAPTFCWVCWKQLQRAPGKRQGNYFFQIVRDQDGVEHRIHDGCIEEAIADGNTLLESPTCTKSQTAIDGNPGASTGQCEAQQEIQ